VIVAVLLALVILAPQARSPRAVAQAATPAPIATPAPVATPVATASPAALAPPSVTPSAVVTPPAAPTPSGAPPPPSALPIASSAPSPYAYRFVPRQPARVAPGQPQIFAVYINQKKLRSHGPIRIKVETSPEVVKVVSRSNGREGVVPLVAAGDFEASGLLPRIPFIAAGMTVDLEFIATGPDGRKTSVRVPVTLE